MSDVKLADCRVVTERVLGIYGPDLRPMTSADLDSLIRERGVTDEMVQVVGKALAQFDLHSHWSQVDWKDYARVALEAALMTKEEE